jgi:O-antigen biosynthesis protein
VASKSTERVRVDGKFFRAGDKKLFIKGITYGPFAPNEELEPFPSRDQTRRDFQQLIDLGANVLRLYYVPPQWFLDLASENGLRLFIDIPWPRHLCFLDSEALQQEACKIVREAVASGKGHPAVFAYSIVNEISAEIVRWSGARRIGRFIDELIDIAKAIDPECLCTFASYPPTEYLHSRNADFVCFNLYLHERGSLEAYLRRLQTLADSKPLVLGEFGMDSIREGEDRKSEFLEWQIETAFRAGLAGTVIFSYTDDWFRGGMQIQDWAFGLTTRHREPKRSFQAVRQQYRFAPYFKLADPPKVSVVVATYNGARTLETCLKSLGQLNYPDYEVIVVDDGSVDATADIARKFPGVRYVHQENRGLSAARNAGIAAATGQVVAFTDDDCRPDEDWLYYLVGDLVRSEFAGMGGHNFLPPEDSYVAAAVAASPGGPAHVMLTDREAEHIPGCNMAFYKWVLNDVGGFDPVFRKAGDDVDICWRIQNRNHKIGFSAAGFVWHYRRSTVRAYLKQQAGYGEAEALLARKHPEYFNSFGGGIWKGRIYATGSAGVILRRAVIYHGVFGSGFFQRVYTANPAMPLMLCTSLLYHIFVSLPLLLGTFYFPSLWPLAAASFGISAGVCLVAAAQAGLPKNKRRFWSRPLVAILFFLQPVVRGWSRLKVRLNLQLLPRSRPVRLDERVDFAAAADTAVFWSRGEVDRYQFLHHTLEKMQAQPWPMRIDMGWAAHDLEVLASPWSRVRLTTTTEELDLGRKSIRCRLESRWSARAWLVFGAVLLVIAPAIAMLSQPFPWIWMVLTALPLLNWFLEEEKQGVEQATALLLEQAADDKGLVKVDNKNFAGK